MILFMSDPVAESVESLRRLLTVTGLSVSRAATLAKVDRSKVYDWMNDKATPQKLSEVQKVLDAAKAYQKSNFPEGRNLKRGLPRIIPVMAGLRAGVPNRSHADVDELEVLDWGTDNERWGRYIEGDSMLPLLQQGDLVIFEARAAEPNHVVHAEFDKSEDTVKVYRRRGGIGQLLPTNPHFEAIDLTGKWIVKGVAVQVIRKMPHDEDITFNFPRGMRFRD